MSKRSADLFSRAAALGSDRREEPQALTSRSTPAGAFSPIAAAQTARLCYLQGIICL
jgi:hypothetical protein